MTELDAALGQLEAWGLLRRADTGCAGQGEPVARKTVDHG